jgi:hypothetical protein
VKLLWVAQSGWLRERVRRTVVAEAEKDQRRRTRIVYPEQDLAP